MSTVKFGRRRFRALANDKMARDSSTWQDVVPWTGFVADPGDWVEQDDLSATLVTSLLEADPVFGQLGQHWPVIDIDLPCSWVPSTDPDHGHLYINKAVSFAGLMEILRVLAKHGIVQHGFADAAEARGYSTVRVPGLRKPTE